MASQADGHGGENEIDVDTVLAALVDALSEDSQASTLSGGRPKPPDLSPGFGGPKDFTLVAIGGAYTARFSPYREIEVMKGPAANTTAQRFCTSHDLPISYTWSIAVFGQRGARILGNEWVRKMQHYYDDYMEVGLGWDPLESQASYTESKEFTDFYMDPIRYKSR